MVKLQTLKPRLASAPARLRSATTRENRITGRALQSRRLRIWTEDPHCACCGKLTAYPDGFELDHKTALMFGGQDTDENCQVLCVERQPDGTKSGCHVAKSAEDMKG